MAGNFRQSLSASIIGFNQHIKPSLEKILSGELVSVEGNTLDETSRLLDTLAGIDIWWVNPKHGMRGIASRIQPGRNWRTFTIRKDRDSGAKTEYEKRKNAIDNEFLYPVITYQAYVGEHGVSIGIGHTKDIINCIENGLCDERRTGDDQDGQATFYVVKWDVFRLRYQFIELLNDKIINMTNKGGLTS